MRYPVPDWTMLGFQDGWGDLYTAISKSDLLSPALSKNAYLSIETQLKAYDNVGLLSNTPIKGAFVAMMRLMHAQIIPDKDFRKSLHSIALSLMPSLLGRSQSLKHKSASGGSTVFALENGQGIKSNVWVFLLIMRDIQSMCTPTTWQEIVKKVWIVTRPIKIYVDSNGEELEVPLLAHIHQYQVKPSSFTMPPRPCRLVLADDCAYSGNQMLMLASHLTSQQGFTFDSVVMCPVYATVAAIELVSDNVKGLSLIIPRLIGYPRDVSLDLGRQDVAMCIQGPHASGSGWAVLSLFDVLGVLRQHIKVQTQPNHNPDSNFECERGRCRWFQGIHVSATTSMVGAAAVVFAHKVADTASIPTRWFTLGATLRRAVDTVCPSMICQKNGRVTMRVALMKMADLLNVLDYNPDKPCNQHKPWSFHDDLAKPSLIMCSEKAIAPAFATCNIRSKVIDVTSMPVFAPILQPVGACGPHFKVAQDKASHGAWWDMTHAEMMTYNNLAGSARCITPQYKANILTRLQALLAENKSVKLGKALGIQVHDRKQE